MKIVVLSDIHGNLPALELVINQEKNYDKLFSLGDVVNYGPWSNECVEFLDSLDKCFYIVGNHEAAYIEGKYIGHNKVAICFFNHCYPHFNRHETIKTYVNEISSYNFCLTHTLSNQYIYHDTDIMIDKNYFIGHSHRMFKKSIGEFSLINVGSVGQNRVNLNEINYVVWYPEENGIELKSIFYNSDILINEMKVRKYPEFCIDYIRSKQKIGK